MKEGIKEKLTNDILAIISKGDPELQDHYKYGNSVSSVKTRLKEDFNWIHIPSNTYDFETLLENLGFELKPARTKNGFHKSTIIISL